MANVKTRGEIQKCNVCGNITEVLHVGGGLMVCCGQPMELLIEKTSADEGKEKHVPVMEKTANGVKIRVGSIAHPMEEKHYIEWIEIWPEGEEKSCRKYLNPGDAPEAEFSAKGGSASGGKTLIRAYCNVHGLWKS